MLTKVKILFLRLFVQFFRLQASYAHVHHAAGAVPADFYPGGHLEGAAGVLLHTHLQRAEAVPRVGGLRVHFSDGDDLLEPVQEGVGAQ